MSPLLLLSALCFYPLYRDHEFYKRCEAMLCPRGQAGMACMVGTKMVGWAVPSAAPAHGSTARQKQ